jgi:prepilin peptidase CpaA
MLTLGASAAVMAGALYTDLRQGVIPNALTYPAVFLGLALAYAVGGGEQVLSSVYGFGLGFGVLFLGFMFGGIGGGDVKLAGALGALTGLGTTVLGLLYMGLLSGALALGIMIWKGKLLRSLKNMWRFMYTSLIPFLETESLDEENSDPFPLGVAIVGGWAWALIEQWRGVGSILGIEL